MTTEATAGALSRLAGAKPAPDTQTATPEIPRVVLDSNIWVDLLVFQDPQTGPIRDALELGTIALVNRADCREELRRVLAYPQFARFDVDIDAAMSAVDEHTTLQPLPDDPDSEAEARRLPRCSDTDDQKFIELAHFARAACLVSKDKAVLKLRSRLRRTSGVEVMTPAAFGQWLVARATAEAR